MLDSCLSWIGGKRILRKEIIPYIDIKRCYAEVFGGGGMGINWKATK